MYDDLHNINDEQSEHTDDDDIVNNLDDLEHSEVEETPYANNVDDAEDGKFFFIYLGVIKPE